MSKSSTNVLEKSNLLFAHPKSYVAVIYNDDKTYYETVVRMLTVVFRKSKSEAQNLANETHEHGFAVVVKSSYNYVKEKVEDAREFMTYEGFPNFKIEIEEE